MSSVSWSAVDDAVRVAALAAAALLGGCGIWYRPVPITTAIGKERAAIAGDSFNVHRDARFEIYGPGSRPVFDAYEQLNRSYRAFDRYFASPVPHLVVVLYPEFSKPRDTAAVSALRILGHPVLRFVRPATASHRERVGEEGYEGSLWPVGPSAVRLLLASFASTTGDTASLATLPAWYRAAVMSLTGGATSAQADVQYMKENRGGRLPIEQMLATERTTTADSTLDPYRRDAGEERDRAFAAQSSAFMQFLLEREGSAAMAALGRAFARGETFASVASTFKVLPRSAAELDERWINWLAAQKGVWQ